MSVSPLPGRDIVLSIAKGVWLGTVGIVILAIVLIVFGGFIGEMTRRKLSSEFTFNREILINVHFMDWLVRIALDATGI